MAVLGGNRTPVERGRQTPRFSRHVGSELWIFQHSSDRRGDGVRVSSGDDQTGT
jgi:hypothetical protein